MRVLSSRVLHKWLCDSEIGIGRAHISPVSTNTLTDYQAFNEVCDAKETHNSKQWTKHDVSELRKLAKKNTPTFRDWPEDDTGE